MKGVVVVGGGLGGLSTGVLLAKNGYEVCVLEQGVQIGGCLQCFYRRGVKFETGMHFIGSADEGQILNKMLRYLEIADKISLSRLDTARYHTVALGGERFDFANGKEPFIEQMATYFPAQKDNLEKYYNIVESISASSALHTLKNGTTDNAINLKYQLTSINEVIESLIDDPLLQKVLVGDLPLYAAVRDRTPFAVHAFIMDFYNQSTFRIVGGSDRVARALVDVIAKYGGEVRTQSRVTRIVCDEKKATGVEVNGCEFIKADYVISATHPMRTLEMLRDTHLIRPVFRNRICNIPQTTGAFSVYLRFKSHTVPYMNYNFFGYNSDTPWGCEEYDESNWPKGYLYVHTCSEPGQLYADAGLILTYMRMDELKLWEHTYTGKRGADYDAFVTRRARLLIDSLEKQFPGIGDCIASFYVASPLTYRDYTGTEGGSLYGVARDLTLGAAGRVPHKTRIPNVFMTGQNVNSHGVLGVIIGAMITSSELLTSDYIYTQIMETNNC